MEGKRGSECLLKSVSNIDFNPTFGVLIIASVVALGISSRLSLFLSVIIVLSIYAIVPGSEVKILEGFSQSSFGYTCSINHLFTLRIRSLRTLHRCSWLDLTFSYWAASHGD